MKPTIWLLVLVLISLASAFEVSPTNPSPGDEIIISGRRVLTFKASHVLKDLINNSGSSR